MVIILYSRYFCSGFLAENYTKKRGRDKIIDKRFFVAMLLRMTDVTGFGMAEGERKDKAMENPFPYHAVEGGKRYHTWDYHLKEKFGGKVFKVSLDGGFSCPNIDGTRGVGGCTYCSYTQRKVAPADLRTQFEEVKAVLHKKWPGAAQYIPYFQANTSTYGSLSELKEKYELMLAQPGVVGLSIATRADALPDDVADYLAELNQRTYLIVELGLQTIHDETAERINRGHSYGEFLAGYEKLAARGIPVCVHIINGLPGETKDMMVETMAEIAKLNLHSVKIHLLHIIAGTKLAEEYVAGQVEPMTMEDYVEVVCDQLELLPAEVIIQRITGDGMKDSLLAPRWSLKKFVVMNAIDGELVKRRSYQGIYSHWITGKRPSAK